MFREFTPLLAKILRACVCIQMAVFSDALQLQAHSLRNHHNGSLLAVEQLVFFRYRLTELALQYHSISRIMGKGNVIKTEFLPLSASQQAAVTRYGDSLEKLLFPCKIMCFLAGFQLFGSLSKLRGILSSFLSLWKVFGTFAATLGFAANMYGNIYSFFNHTQEFYIFSWQAVGLVNVWVNFLCVCMVSESFAKTVDCLTVTFNSQTFQMNTRTVGFLWLLQAAFFVLLGVHISCFVFGIVHRDTSNLHGCSDFFPNACHVSEIHMQALDDMILGMILYNAISRHTFSFYLSIITFVFSCHVVDISMHIDSLRLHYNRLRQLLSRFLRLSSLHLLTSTVCMVQRILTLILTMVVFGAPEGSTIAAAIVATLSSFCLIAASIYLNRSVSTQTPYS